MIEAKALQELFETFRPFHSAFQIDHYIVARAGGTPYGMFKQSVRELRARWQALCDLYIQREKLSRSKASKQVLRRTQEKIRRDELEIQIRDTEREFRRFYAHAVKLKKHLGKLTDERIDELERELWIHRLKQHAALDIISTGRPSREFFELMMALDAETRKPLLDAISTDDGRKGLIDWVAAWEPEYDIDRSCSKSLPKGGAERALLDLGRS